MIEFNRTSSDTLTFVLSGQWEGEGGHPKICEAIDFINKESGIKKLSFDLSGIATWNTSLPVYLKKILDYCANKNIAVDEESLPSGIRGIINIAGAVNDHTALQSSPLKRTLLERLGSGAGDVVRSAMDVFLFIGESTLAWGRLFTGKSSVRAKDVMLLIQECGIDALPIVSLISILVGLILAFVGSVQLKLFGAQVYIANLVGIGVVREMGAIMAGIIMAGRTGASFAAQIGTMETNEEIDALRTLGISPMEFLVLPRMIAMILMMPLLVLYADLMGVLGGFVVGIGMFDIGFIEYLNQTVHAIRIKDVVIGLIMGVVFGYLIAATGCLRGMQCERSASAVGEATTSAVVTGIVSIVMATALITYICAVIKI